MSPSQKEPTLEESIAQVMETLPPPIQEYLRQGNCSVIAGNLTKKYSLHIDQAGILEQEIMLLLMGIENPDEFVQSLREQAQLDQQTINGITQDVNALIFIPLREKMRNGAKAAPQRPPSPPPLSRPVGPPVRVNIPAPNYAPPRPLTAPSVQASRPAPVAPPPPTSRPAPAAPEYQPSVMIQANPSLPTRPQQGYINKVVPKHVPPRPQSSRPPTPGMPQRPPVAAKPTQPPPQTINIVINTAKMLEDHEEPHIEFKGGAARTAPPPPNLPGVMVAPSPRPVPPAAPKQPAPPPISRAPYSADPYREPLDEESA